MAKKNAPAAPAALNMALLAAISAATSSPLGYGNDWASADLQPLKNAGLVDVHPDASFAKNQDLSFPAVKINANGVTALGQTASPFGGAPASAPAAAPVAPKATAADTYKIAEMQLPEREKRSGGVGGGARPEKFPFSGLDAIGKVFFIPATAEVQSPEKKYASTVASASQRYATEDTTQPQVAKRKSGRMAHPLKYDRKFVIVKHTAAEGNPFGVPAGTVGAIVGRTV